MKRFAEMQEPNIKVRVVVWFAVLVCFGLLCVAFGRQILSIGLSPLIIAFAIVFVVFVAVGLTRMQAQPRFPGLGALLAFIPAFRSIHYSVFAAPDRAAIFSICGIAVGLLSGAFIYRSWRNHLSEGVIVYKPTLKLSYEIVSSASAFVLLILMLLISSFEKLFYLVMAWAMFSISLYLAIALSHLEQTTRKKIKLKRSPLWLSGGLASYFIIETFILAGLILLAVFVRLS